MRLLISLSLCIFLFVGATIVKYATTWAGVGNLQTITQTAIKDAVTTGKLTQSSAYTIPTGLKCITKADAATYNLAYYYGVSIRGTNDVLVKADFRTIRADVTAGRSECSTTSPNYTLTLYHNGESFEEATTLYTNKELTTTYSGGSIWIVATDGYWTFSLKVNSSGVITWAQC